MRNFQTMKSVKAFMARVKSLALNVSNNLKLPYNSNVVGEKYVKPACIREWGNSNNGKCSEKLR